MKLFFAHFFFFTCLFSGFSQLQPAPGEYRSARTEEPMKFENRDIIWSEDFANGIGNGWTNQESGGVAFWEYRGPNTDPNIETGGRGSCFAPGTVGDPIMSPSWGNGFVIFDSNWWDNPDNPCSPEFFGTGPAPGPHFATLTSPVIDLSAYSNVALVFNHFMNIYQGEVRVEVSTGGGIWSVIYMMDPLQNPGLPDDQVYLQISPFVANNPNVQIRFVFNALYYYWQLDDITLVETLTNDLTIRSASYGDFDMTDPAHSTGYEFMEYTKYPVDMAPELKLSAKADNLGAMTQSDCRLHVDITRDSDGSLVYAAESDEGTMLFPGFTQELRAGTYQMPEETDYYKLHFYTSQNEAEEFPDNNNDTLSFFIDEVQYARDHLYTTAVYIGIPEYEDTPYKIGNVFLVTRDNMYCHSISTAVGIGSSTPTSVYGALYALDMETGINTTLIAATPPIDLSPEMINSYGDQIIVNLPFNTPIPVDSSTAYFVAVVCEQGIGNFVCAMSGNAEEATALVNFGESDWFYLDRIPMVRMNFGFYDAVAETTEIPLRIYPNPSSTEVLVDLSSWPHNDGTMRIFDVSGRCVYENQLRSVAGRRLTVDLRSWESGIYHLVLSDGSRLAHGRIIRN